MGKFRQKIGDSRDPFETKREAKKFAERVRKRGRRAEIRKADLFAKSRGFRFEVLTGQKKK